MENNAKSPDSLRLQIPEWLDIFEKNILGASFLVHNIRSHKWILTDPIHSDLHPYFNNSLFAAMNNLDLMISLKYLEGSMRVGNIVEANYFARVIALHLYEIFNDLHKLVDKAVRKTIIDGLGNNGIREMDSRIKEMNTLKKKHISYLKEIRNNIIGHKLEDANKQSDMIREVDTVRIYDIATQTFALQLKVTGCYTTIIEQIPHPSSRKI